MKSEETLAQELDEFARRTLSEADAGDQDIVDFVRVLGLKLIQGKQGLQEVRNLLEEIVKEKDVVDKFISHFTSERVKVEEEEAKKAEAERVEKGKEESEGKIVVNKSDSDVPAIYKEMEEKRGKEKGERQGRSKERRNEQRPNERNNQSRTNARNIQQRIGDKRGNTKPAHREHQKRPANTQPTHHQRTEEGAEQPHEKVAVQLPDLQGKSKCRFFPFCTNEGCEFFHPTEKCSRFPRCSFKERCLFMHEACKFAESCTRPDCFYDHPFNKRKSNDPLMSMMKMMMAANKNVGKPKRHPRPQAQQNNNQG